MAIRKTNPQFIQAVDYPQNARDLNDAAKEAGVVADVVDRRRDRHAQRHPGGRSGAGARAARGQAAEPEAARACISYDGGAQHIKGFKNRLDQTLKRFEPSLETLRTDQAVRAQHRDLQRRRHRHLQHPAEGVAGVTDVQVGSYIFMDCQYLEIGGESNEEVYTDFAPSLTVDRDGAQHLLREVDHHRRRREGAHARTSRDRG